MNIYFKTFENNKKKFMKMYFIVFFFCLLLSVEVYNSSFDKIARLISAEIANNVVNENYNSIRNTCLKIVPDIFEEIQIFKGDKEVFNYKSADVKFYFKIQERISVGKDPSSISDAIVVFKVDIFPLLVVSAIVSLISILMLVPFLILEYNKNELNKNNYFFSLSRRLAHDIRSPLSTLNLISGKIEKMEIKELQLAVIAQINHLANSLLDNTKKNSFIGYSDLLKQIEREFRLKANGCNIIFENRSKSEGDLHFAPNFLYATLCNLIQNSIDASNSEHSRISIVLSIEKNFVLIKIEDNGQGIPEDVLRKLGTSEVTYGKGAQGNGIGFFNAYKNIASFGGKLDVESKIGTGTTIEVRLPK